MRPRLPLPLSLLSLSLSSSSGAHAPSPRSSAPAAVERLLSRVVGPAAAARFDLAVVPALPCGRGASPVGECATVADAARPGRIEIRSTSVPSLAFGAGAYLR